MGRMIISQISGDRVDAFSETVATQTSVRITTSYSSGFTDLVVALDQASEIAEIEILTDSATIIELRELFFTTTHLVDYIQEGNIEIRAQDSHLPSLIISEESIKVITGFPDENPTVVETTEGSFLKDTIGTFDKRFENANDVSFRKPGYSSLLGTLRKSFNESLIEDFEDALREAKESERPSLEIDPVIISLLVGGYNEMSFYELSLWGEDVKLGSRAKFSRFKRELEEERIIDYEQIPTQVGRPRHRLLLGDAVDRESINDIVTTAIQNCSSES